MTTFEVGRRAEAAAAAYLVRQGCKIIEQNWRTRMCEIDVIALRDGIAYFCEVKYRRTHRYGAGLDYITPKKLKQMRFAAESWVHRHDWRGEYCLCAIEITGPKMRITAVTKDL